MMRSEGVHENSNGPDGARRRDRRRCNAKVCRFLRRIGLGIKLASNKIDAFVL